MFQDASDVPVLFLVYNRPELTKMVFNEIKRVRPKKLFINCDGAKNDKVGDDRKVAETRSIVKEVDWDCDLRLNFHDQNKGCKDAVNEGLDWFFENNEAGIILEDDCLPDLSFFSFCKELLKTYRNDDRVMQISGTNTQITWNRSRYSYYFSIYGSIWGWASWRRVWISHDKDINYWPELRDSDYYLDLFPSVNEALKRKEKYDKVYNGEIDTWDRQWQLSKLVNNGLNIIPKSNLVKNIGFETEEAAHGYRKKNIGNLPLKSIQSPLEHPPWMLRDKKLERRDAKNGIKRGPRWHLKNLPKLINCKYRQLF